jgi:ATP-dependent Clp protease protease subunit
MDLGKEFQRYAMLDKGISSLTMQHYVESSLTPYIIEERQLNVAQMDVFFALDDGPNHLLRHGHQ